MKQYVLLVIILLLNTTIHAQKPCEISVNLTDSLGNYKATKDYLLYEKIFNGKSSYIFASLVLADGTPALNLQFIEKSMEFIKAKCFDKNSKIYLQLMNGKIVTLIHIDKDNCPNMVRDDNGFNNRILTGYFLFKKDSYEDLKSSSISLMRIKFSTENEDYILKKELKSELNGNTYEPENYFKSYLHCIE
jgi:hypothetical protein